MITIKTETLREITPKQLAEALADSHPEDFAKFWFIFHEVMDDGRLEAFAKEMAPSLGSNRKKPLRELCRLIDFYEMQEERAKKDDTEPEDS